MSKTKEQNGDIMKQGSHAILGNKMREANRKLGIDIMDNLPWGTHLYQFYKTKKDLIDILVPYFNAGFEKILSDNDDKNDNQNKSS